MCLYLVFYLSIHHLSGLFSICHVYLVCLLYVIFVRSVCLLCHVCHVCLVCALYVMCCMLVIGNNNLSQIYMSMKLKCLKLPHLNLTAVFRGSELLAKWPCQYHHYIHLYIDYQLSIITCKLHVHVHENTCTDYTSR